ncbi:hypothetical protein QIH80_38140 [Bradyrhizobium elkanii]|nr:hypothetical protein QIH80_38140 [Bradyrhizobium elkanii]
MRQAGEIGGPDHLVGNDGKARPVRDLALELGEVTADVGVIAGFLDQVGSLDGVPARSRRG